MEKIAELIVEVCTVDEVNPHPNADRLELLTVKGWKCVGKLGEYKPGQKVVYFPIDSILSEETEDMIFGPDSKIRPKKGRIRTIKIRGAIAQGMCVPLHAVMLPEDIKVGTDVKDKLGVKKWEPTVKPNNVMNVGSGSVKNSNPHFTKYSSPAHLNNYVKGLEGEQVVAREKIHGTNFRAGYVLAHADTLWKKIQKFFGFLPKYEFVYGSHNVQLQNRKTDNSVYKKTVDQYNLREILGKDQVIYGEIFGDGIQKNYSYGLKNGQTRLAVFDLKEYGEYVDDSWLEMFCKDKGFIMPPVLYKGIFDLEKIKAVLDGPSVLYPEQKIREGVVVRTAKEQTKWFGRALLKYISEGYLLQKGNTEFH